MGLFEDLIEVLYLYKTSKLYYIHIALMGILFGLHVYFFVKKNELVEKEKNPPQSKCSQKVDYVDYQRLVKANTAK